MVAQERKKSVVEHPPTLLGGTAIKPVERHGFEAIRYLIYNPDTGEVFTRTPKSWFLITLFYCIYYSCLAAFWYGMLTLFLSTVPEFEPRYMKGDSLIGKNPGVGIRPIQAEENIDSSMFLLQFNAKGETPSNKPAEGKLAIDFGNRLDAFLEPYRKQDENDNLVDCSNGVPDEAYENADEKKDEFSDDEEKDAYVVKRKACKFPLEESAKSLPACMKMPYGYNADGANEYVKPCMFLKVNNIFNWKPKPFKAEDLTDTLIKEKEMPARVQELIRQDDTKIYVHCDGENPADRDDLQGLIKYSPEDQSFDLKYFPYTQEKKNYVSPLVAIQFDIPSKHYGRLFHVQCRLWHTEVEHNTRDKIGLVRFELLLEMDEEKRKKQKEVQEKEGYNA